MVEKINETKYYFIQQANEIDNPLTRLNTRGKKRRHSLSISKNE